jgi:hypothetical protein
MPWQDLRTSYNGEQDKDMNTAVQIETIMSALLDQSHLARRRTHDYNATGLKKSLVSIHRGTACTNSQFHLAKIDANG